MLICCTGNLLIVDDNTQEMLYAFRMGFEHGYCSLPAGDLAQAKRLMEFGKPVAIVTDLFFPLSEDPAPYVAEVLPAYQARMASRYSIDPDENILLRSVQQTAETVGMSAEEWAGLLRPKRVRDDTLAVLDKSRRYDRFKGSMEDLADGIRFPSGIFLAREARERGIPCVVVTSVNHHADEFEAVKDMLDVPYVDVLVNGHKDWARGFGLLGNAQLE